MDSFCFVSQDVWPSRAIQVLLLSKHAMPFSLADRANLASLASWSIPSCFAISTTSDLVKLGHVVGLVSLWWWYVIWAHEARPCWVLHRLGQVLPKLLYMAWFWSLLSSYHPIVTFLTFLPIESDLRQSLATSFLLIILARLLYCAWSSGAPAFQACNDLFWPTVFQACNDLFWPTEQIVSQLGVYHLALQPQQRVMWLYVGACCWLCFTLVWVRHLGSWSMVHLGIASPGTGSAKNALLGLTLILIVMLP